MAQWSRADRTLQTKIVYYGPALGGKTSNLETLHRIADPLGSNPLLSVNTDDDRTLFFDLLPFDDAEILGHRVAIKLFTVPGQVRYDTTRQVVLAGADAVVFVADSTAEREEQNRWSLQNLRMNMRATGLDAASVPVVFQFNKQDLPEAAAPPEVARWIDVDPRRAHASVATEGPGVAETLVAATLAMLERLVERADESTKRVLDAGELPVQVQRAFAPLLARAKKPGRVTTDGRLPIIVRNEDLLENAVDSSVQLGERLIAETARATRLEREAAVPTRAREATAPPKAPSLPALSREARSSLEALRDAAARLVDSRAGSASERKEIASSIRSCVEGLERRLDELVRLAGPPPSKATGRRGKRPRRSRSKRTRESDR